MTRLEKTDAALFTLLHDMSLRLGLSAYAIAQQPDPALFLSSVQLALSADRLRDVAIGRYPNPTQMLRRSLAKLSLIHADLRGIESLTVLAARKGLCADITLLQQILDAVDDEPFASADDAWLFHRASA